MAEAIDDLFVRLGLESDQQQFQQAERQFDSLRATALQAGAAIGAGFGLNELTFGFANATDEMRRFAEIYSVAPEFVDQLGFAFERTGGDARDAFSSIQTIANLIEQTQWGEIPADAFREFGVDPMMLQGVESIAEAYDRIVNAAQGMSPETARRFFSAMGLSEADLRLARGTGDESFRNLMAEAESRAELDQSMLDSARAFTTGTAQLQRSLEGVSREISDLFVGDLGESMTNLADWLDSNRDAITDFADEALPYLKSMAIALGVLVSIQSARAALGILRSVPGLTALTAGIGYGLYQGADADDNQASGEDQASRLQRRLQRLDEQIGIAQDVLEDSPDNERLEQALDGLMEERRQVLDMLGGSDLPSAGPDQSFAPARGDTNISLNVDARGAQNPEAVRQNVERGVDAALARAAENALLDISTGVS